MIKDMSGHNKYEGSFTDPIKVMIPTNVRRRFTLVTSRNIMTMNLKSAFEFFGEKEETKCQYQIYHRLS